MLTASERQVLRALAAPGATRGAWNIWQLVRARPDLLPGRHPNGITITLHSLMRKGLVRRTHRAVFTNSGGRVAWALTDAGREVIA